MEHIKRNKFSGEQVKLIEKAKHISGILSSISDISKKRSDAEVILEENLLQPDGSLWSGKQTAEYWYKGKVDGNEHEEILQYVMSSYFLELLEIAARKA